MSDFDKTKSQLISELEEMRKRNAYIDAQKLYQSTEEQTPPGSPDLEKTLLQEIPAAIIVHGSHGEILSCNKKAQEMLGVTKKEMVGRNVVDPGWEYLNNNGYVLPSENFPVNQVLASKKTVEDFTIGLRRPNQSDIQWVYVNANPVLDNAGEVSQVIVTFVDITEVKKAEEAFRRTRFSVDQSIDSIYWLDAEGNILDVNDAATSNLGYTKEEFLSMKVHDLGDEFLPDVWKSHWKLIKEKKHLLFEATQIRKNGTAVPVETNSNFVVFDGEELVYAFTRDITDRKRAEEALKESEKKIKSIIEHSSEMFYIHDTNNILTYVSPQSIRIFGYTPEEMKINWTQLITDNPLNEAGILHTQNALKTGKKQPLYQLEIQCKDGSIAWIEIDESPLKDEQGNVVGIVGAVQNITERKHSEEALRDSEKQFRTLFETSRDALGFASPEGIIIDVNQSWLDQYGYSYNEVIGSDVRIIYLNPDDRKLFSKKLEKNEYVKDYEIKLLTKGNRAIDCLVTANVCRDDNGNVRYYQTITRDITERKRLEEQLQIRERMDSLATLVGGIAHDFNNLLMGIMGNIDLLRMDADILNHDHADYVEEAFQSCQRAAKLIKKIQTLSKGSISKPTSVDIYHVAKDVFSIMERTTDKLIEKKIDFGPGKYFVLGDYDQLHQVLLNLGTNAVHAIEKKGVQSNDCITITAKKHDIIKRDRTGLSGGVYIHIFFKDTGTGMSGRVKRSAFDPLFTTKDRGPQKGQGLGLAMAYNIITRYHQGAIDIETSTGKGTILHIYLPEAEKKAAQKFKKAEYVPGGNETILIVEDEAAISKMAEEALKKVGYSILTAFDGKEGLDVYNEYRETIGLVVLDLTMPTMSGKMFLERILEINPEVKVVISSGHSEEVLQKYTEAKGYVTKPYMLKDLVRMVRTVLDM